MDEVVAPPGLHTNPPPVADVDNTLFPQLVTGVAETEGCAGLVLITANIVAAGLGQDPTVCVTE
jgi:hypothetical protein